MKYFLSSIFILLVSLVYSQENKPVYNLTLSEEDMQLDSSVVFEGKYSMSIKGTEPNFRACAYVISDYYQGDSITLSGYIKTGNVGGGFARLWMRIDPQIAFDNMHQKAIVGTTDWQNMK